MERPVVCYGCGEDYAERGTRLCRGCASAAPRNCPQCSGGGVLHMRSGAERCAACDGKGVVDRVEVSRIRNGPFVWSN